MTQHDKETVKRLKSWIKTQKKKKSGEIEQIDEFLESIDLVNGIPKDYHRVEDLRSKLIRHHNRYLLIYNWLKSDYINFPEFERLMDTIAMLKNTREFWTSENE